MNRWKKKQCLTGPQSHLCYGFFGVLPYFWQSNAHFSNAKYDIDIDAEQNANNGGYPTERRYPHISATDERLSAFFVDNIHDMIVDAVTRCLRNPFHIPQRNAGIVVDNPVVTAGAGA